MLKFDTIFHTMHGFDFNEEITDEVGDIDYWQFTSFHISCRLQIFCILPCHSENCNNIKKEICLCHKSVYTHSNVTSWYLFTWACKNHIERNPISPKPKKLRFFHFGSFFNLFLHKNIPDSRKNANVLQLKGLPQQQKWPIWEGSPVNLDHLTFYQSTDFEVHFKFWKGLIQHAGSQAISTYNIKS